MIETAIEKYLKLNYSYIFINELSAWYTDERKFQKLSYALFLEWFEISMNTMIFDMVDMPIERMKSIKQTTRYESITKSPQTH